MGQLEVSVRDGYQNFLGGWETASQTASSILEIVNSPGCNCKRSCDKNQFVMPQVVVDDEVAYSLSQVNDSTGTSPFSPREQQIPALPEARARALPSLQIDSATPVEALTVNQNMLNVNGESRDNATVPAKHAAVVETPDSHYPPVDQMGNFGYYAEYVPVLRPPTSICSTNVNTAVRAAPWEKWTKPAVKSQASSQTGSSLISKGGAGTSQAASVLGNLQAFEPVVAAAPAPAEVQSAPKEPVFGFQAQLAPLAPERPKGQLAPVAAAEADVETHDWSWVAPRSTETSSQVASSAVSVAAVSAVAKQADTHQPASHNAAQDPVREVKEVAPPVQSVSPEAMAPRSKPKREAASVLSHSAMKSSVAMSLGGAMEPRSRSNTAKGDDRKSALSVSTPMTSSAALALGGLSKVSAKKPERSSNESNVLGNAPSTKALAPRSDVGDDSIIPEATAAAAAPKVAKPRQGGSRSRGPDAKSVISGLNTSSSASALLLGSMLQNQPKRRSARPAGSDVASVV